jgi:hypothetical protein
LIILPPRAGLERRRRAALRALGRQPAGRPRLVRGQPAGRDPPVDRRPDGCSSCRPPATGRADTSTSATGRPPRRGWRAPTAEGCAGAACCAPSSAAARSASAIRSAVERPSSASPT